jgi:hypothetical protein
VEALVYTEGELDADESSYSDDRQTPVTTDSDILEITEGYIDTIHAEMEDGLKNDTVSLTDPTYDEWFSMGMNLGVKSQWSSKFDADDARQWLDRGFTFEDAIMWDGSGFTPDQAGRLTEEGNFTKPAEVIEWRDRGGFSGYDACILREGGVTLDEAIDWHNGGFGALETVRLRADGISLKEAANWLKTGGFSGGEIAALHENNMSFEEVTGWSSITPFDGHEIIRLRSAGVTPKGAIEWIEKGGFDTYEVADLKMSGISLTEAIEWREDGRFRANEIADLHKSGIGLQQAIDLLADSGADLRDIRQLRSYNEEMSFVDALYQT